MYARDAILSARRWNTPNGQDFVPIGVPIPGADATNPVSTTTRMLMLLMLFLLLLLEKDLFNRTTVYHRTDRQYHSSVPMASKL